MLPVELAARGGELRSTTYEVLHALLRWRLRSTLDKESEGRCTDNVRDHELMHNAAQAVGWLMAIRSHYKRGSRPPVIRHQSPRRPDARCPRPRTHRTTTPRRGGGACSDRSCPAARRPGSSHETGAASINTHRPSARRQASSEGMIISLCRLQSTQSRSLFLVADTDSSSACQGAKPSRNHG
jgi:hypothetical protein